MDNEYIQVPLGAKSLPKDATLEEQNETLSQTNTKKSYSGKAALQQKSYLKSVETSI